VTTVGSDYEVVLTECQVTLDQVDASLARLADGTYGNCSICGEPISDERLAAVPTATSCGRHDG
jgi:RNA polymerase-binding transcription factor DksA